MIADIADTSKIVVEKSTVPVKAAESVTTILRTNHKKGVKYQVCFEPKFQCSKYRSHACSTIVHVIWLR